jgi:hypothetical protein
LDLDFCSESIVRIPWLRFTHILGVWTFLNFSALGAGRLLWAGLKAPYEPGPESLVLKLGLGYGALGYAVLLIGLAGGLYPLVLWVLLALLVPFSFLGRMDGWGKKACVRLSWGEKIILCTLGFFLFFNLILALAPPTSRDALTQHLALPKLFVIHHGVYNIPFSEASFNPLQVDMLYTLVLLLGAEECASLLHFTFALLTGALIYSHLLKSVPRWLALLGPLLFLSTPLVINLASKAYVDLGLTFYAFAAIYALLQKKEGKRNWATISALFVGLAAATKYNGFLVLILLWVWFLLEVQAENNSSFLWGAGKYLLIALAVSSPWLFRNFFYTGNPVFPFFSSWLGSEVPMEQGVYAPLTRRALLYGEGWEDFLTIPIRMFFQGQDGIPRYFDGVLNPIFLFLSPLALMGVREGWRVRMAGFVFLFFLLSLFLVDMRARYILPTLAPLTVLSVLGLVTLRSLPWGKVWVASSLALLLLNFFYLQEFFRWADLALYLQGKESKEEYLSRTLSDYDLWRYANRHLPEDAKVMMYFLGNRGYYCDREYIYDSYYSGKRLKQVLSGSPSAERLVEYFRGLRITHIALRKDSFDQFTEANLLSPEKEAWREFRTRHLRLLYEGKGYQLYQVQGGLDASGV